MTRKDYIIIAETLKQAFEDESLSISAFTSLSASFARKLKQENPRFDTLKWFKYLGFKDKE